MLHPFGEGGLCRQVYSREGSRTFHVASISDCRMIKPSQDRTYYRISIPWINRCPQSQLVNVKRAARAGDYRHTARNVLTHLLKRVSYNLVTTRYIQCNHHIETADVARDLIIAHTPWEHASLLHPSRPCLLLQLLQTSPSPNYYRPSIGVHS